ncbi:MAG: bifunctional glutamate N-acetyltransferase/amino-acid acetyltransferase ArgJ [Candidatus Latescibacterota bacterium]|nr:bifunctional glutamate N-acetyltransferase/amino-acid acetyltransferase ArgJ [Candidatus Latescibacterota bacterium]
MENVQNGSVTHPRGFLASGVRGGIKPGGDKLDVAIVASEVPAKAAAVYTKNLVQAAPLYVCREHLSEGKPIRAVVFNSGNANACTGEEGLLNAHKMCSQVAELLSADSSEVLVCSTGVIGVQLPMDAVDRGISMAYRSLSQEGGDDASLAIMTTDLVPKVCAVELEIDGVQCFVGGMAKGSGMIAPDMATMLGLLTTDANVTQDVLQTALSRAVQHSFNCITVDGDMSTNDTVIALANGLSKGTQIKAGSPGADRLTDAFEAVCRDLARKIARDGEGATKLVSIEVVGASSEKDARSVGLSVANSNLVKTAVFGRDPNWGRILCAMGYSGVGMDPQKVTVELCGTSIFAMGSGLSFNHPSLVEAMGATDIPIVIDLKSGTARAEIFTCDLSYDYVRINAEYTT